MERTLALKKNTNLAYAWSVFALACCFVIFKYVLEISPSVMVQDLMRTFNLDGLYMGHLAACYFYAYFLMQIPVGLLVDRFSTRNIIACAILLCSLGAFVFSHASVFYMATFGRILIGIGGAFSMVGTMKLITIWFDRKQFALISGLMMAAAMIGAICGQAPLASLVDAAGLELICSWCYCGGTLHVSYVGASFVSLLDVSSRCVVVSLLCTL